MTTSNYWPGTKIIKSQGNAFNWQNYGSKIAATTEWKQSEISTQRMAGTGSDKKKQFTVYSKARPSK